MPHGQGMRTVSISAPGRSRSRPRSIGSPAPPPEGRAPTSSSPPRDAPQYAMPAAGWAAESGDPDPVRHRAPACRPPPGRRCSPHQSPHIYVLGPPSVIPDSVVAQLAKLRHRQASRRVRTRPPTRSRSRSTATRRARSASRALTSPAASDGRCAAPVTATSLINAGRTLDAAAAAPLSASGSFGPQLLIDDAGLAAERGAQLLPRLRHARLHARRGRPRRSTTTRWMIGDQHAVSVSVQAEMDTLLEAVPQK